MMIMDYIILAVLWIAWCVVHSLLISVRVTEFFKRTLKSRYKYYRLIYNLISFLSLGWLGLYSLGFKHTLLLGWSGYWQALRLLLLLLTAFFFWTGARHYDKAQFLGISQILNNNSAKGIGAGGALNTSGIMAWTRHPWYLATILLLWSYFSHLYISTLIINVILTLYVIIGMLLEEKKLLREFGEDYKKYQKAVPILIPYRRPSL